MACLLQSWQMNRLHRTHRLFSCQAGTRFVSSPTEHRTGCHHEGSAMLQVPKSQRQLHNHSAPRDSDSDRVCTACIFLRCCTSTNRTFLPSPTASSCSCNIRIGPVRPPKPKPAHSQRSHSLPAQQAANQPCLSAAYCAPSNRPTRVLRVQVGSFKIFGPKVSHLPFALMRGSGKHTGCSSSTPPHHADASIAHCPCERTC